MTAACATGRLRATSLSFARSLSTWSPGTGAPKPASVAGARRLPGTTATCSRSSHPKLMREPCPLGHGAVHRLHNVEHSHGPTWELAYAINKDLKTVPPCQTVSCRLRNWYRVYDPDVPRGGTADCSTFFYSVARGRFCRQPARHQY